MRRRTEERQADVLAKFERWLANFEVLPPAKDFDRVAVLHTFDRFQTFLDEHVVLIEAPELPDSPEPWVNPAPPSSTVVVYGDRSPTLELSDVWLRFARIHGYRPDSQANVGELQKRIERHMRSLGIDPPIVLVQDDQGRRGYRGVVLTEIEPEEVAPPGTSIAEPVLHREHLSEATKARLQEKIDAAAKRLSAPRQRRRRF